MNYDNIIYPLDKIYSDAVGTTYPVCGAGHDGPTPIDWKKEYFQIKNISNEVGEFSINNYSSGTLEYSLDKKTWTSYDLSTKPSVEVNPNEKIYLRGTGFKIKTTIGYKNVINFNKDYTVAGNFMSLSNYETMETVNTIDNSNTINCVFFEQSHLISAENLNFGNVITLDEYALYSSFTNCSSLVSPPDFSQIVTVGKRALYYSFSGSSLMYAPNFSNVTSIGNNGMNNIFNSCNITTSPDLSNITSIGESGMSCFFQNCHNLVESPDLRNVTSVGTGGLDRCFQNCYKISTVTAPNVSDLTANSVLNIWLLGAGNQATGTKTVLVPTGATIATSSDSGIPSGWTRVDY